MGLFFYNKIGSIISIGDLPTTNIIEPFYFFIPWGKNGKESLKVRRVRLKESYL